MNYKLLHELIANLEEFESNAFSDDIEVNLFDFADWIKMKQKELLSSEKILEKESDKSEMMMRFADNSRMIVRLYRYAKIYGKKMIPENSPIDFDDYSYLVPLFYRGKMTKKELVQLNLQEKSTGMEIIKRLYALGLIEQEDNMIDKRSKFIFLSPKGTSEMMQIQANMWEIVKEVNGNLTSKETLTLYHLLSKLDLFHAKQLGYE